MLNGDLLLGPFTGTYYSLLQKEISNIPTFTPSLFNQTCRTTRHFCFGYNWLVGFGFNGPLRQYFSLYRAVSQREGEKGKEDR